MRLLSFFSILLFMYADVIAADPEKKRNVVNYLVNIFQNTILSAFKNPYGNNVEFFLFTRENASKSVDLIDNTSLINSIRPVKFLIHGHLENKSASWYKDMSKGLLKKGDYSVIQVDWGFLAGQLYPIAVHSTEVVGNEIGKLIVQLNEENKIPLSNFHLIGHSLGGHVAGFAGKKVFQMTGSKIRQITGLDAAGPLFERPEKPKHKRLSDEDAEIVENVHTDGGILGYKSPIGTIDFYPNGGTRIQTGCGFKGFFTFPYNISALHPVCSHRRSHQYYIQALLNGGIPAVRCDSYENFIRGKCGENEVLILGHDYKNNKTRGIYYF